MTSIQLVTGQKLWWVPRNSTYRKPCEVVVVKVGRKWVQLDNGYRINAQTFEADGAGYSPPGVCYMNQAIYAAELALNQAWLSLQQALRGPRPAGVTLENIGEARAVLGLFC